MKSTTIPLLLLLGATLAGCATPPPAAAPIGMPNPASIYCTQQGGRLEIRKGAQGEQVLCHLPDGRVMDEWELFRARPDSPAA